MVPVAGLIPQQMIPAPGIVPGTMPPTIAPGIPPQIIGGMPPPGMVLDNMGQYVVAQPPQQPQAQPPPVVQASVEGEPISLVLRVR